MYQLDVYASKTLIGSIGESGGKLIFAGDSAFLEELCKEFSGTPGEVMVQLQAKYTGQGLYTRPHGAGLLIEKL